MKTEEQLLKELDEEKSLIETIGVFMLATVVTTILVFISIL